MLTTFNNLKMQLGDAVLSQNTIVAKIDSLKEEYSELEKVLANKYGKDSRIDVQTGEIKELYVRRCKDYLRSELTICTRYW